MTDSVGVAVAAPGEGVDSLIALADNAMYYAKRSGKNRVVPVALDEVTRDPSTRSL